MTYPEQDTESNEMSRKFAETVTEIFAEPFAEQLSQAIDYYVHSISISGTVITNGSPTT